MFKNFFKTSFRHLLNNKLNSLINLGGLALGITVCLFIFLYIHAELSYDREYPGYNHIYRLCSNTWAKSSPSEAREIMNYFPRIKEAGFLSWKGGIMIVNNQHFPAWNGYFADSSILSIFSRKILSGNRNDCLVRPLTAVITKSTAKVWFGDENPIGKTIKMAMGHMSDAPELEITGVIDDFPEKSHMKIDYMISLSTMYKFMDPQWMESRTWMAGYTYVVFKNDEDARYVRENLKEFQIHYQVNDNFSLETLESRGIYYDLMPLSQIHLYSHREQEMQANGNILYIYIFAGLGFLIILIASANFINLFITQALKRAREIGIRKTTGAFKSQILKQFLFEAYLSVILSSILAFVICMATLPVFNSIASQNYSITQMFSPAILTGIVILIIVVGLICGFYPSVFLSFFSITNSMKGNQLPRSTLSYLRKTLVTFQFVAAIFMIISTLVILRQLHYLRNKDLGFDKDHVVAFYTFGDMGDAVRNKREYIYDRLLKNPGILAVGAVSNLMGDVNSVEWLQPDGKEVENFNGNVRCMRVDDGFLKAFNIKLASGRNFNPLTDSSGAFLINEQLAKILDLKNPVGTMATNTASGMHGPIVGVMKDFNYASLHNPIEPLFLEYRPDWTYIIVARIKGSDIQQTLEYVHKIYSEIAPGSLFTYDFINDKLNSMYSAENRMGKIFNIFSVLAIFISCLGLYSLTAWTAKLRIKEIAIRKVFGASPGQLFVMLSKSYIGLIFIAILIAIPLGNYFVTEWLKDFTFHITVSWPVFVIAGVLVLIIALAAVSRQSYITAKTNPAESLKVE